MGRRSMLWLMDEPWGESTLPTRYYRQKAIQARQAAEAATTRAIKGAAAGLGPRSEPCSTLSILATISSHCMTDILGNVIEFGTQR